ncbi:hypothetical protein HK405_015677, partial [Cladochytrium tenue]
MPPLSTLARAAAVAALAVTLSGVQPVLAACGTGLSACGSACYDPTVYTCIGTTLCPYGYSLCGTACYSPSQYHCSGTTLLQGGTTTTTTTTTTSSSSSATGTSYALSDTYSGSTFFSAWTFFTATDPTNGFVQYVSQATAQSSGLISAGSPTIIKTDTTNVYTSGGRPSVRITSNKSYNAGTLFVFDLNHMPYGCGTWPAAWILGPSWPAGGEIDVIEGVNLQTNNRMTLHTSSGCTMSSQVQTGSVVSTDCVAADNGNEGCSVQAATTTSYGSGFNSNGGGVYVTEWSTSAIKIWFFPRGSIPSDVAAGGATLTPSSSWGTPAADFPLGSACTASHFSSMQIVLDLTFCGDWAGSVFTCSGSGNAACQTYVGDNPSAFTEAYWSINSIKTYVN